MNIINSTNIPVIYSYAEENNIKVMSEVISYKHRIKKENESLKFEDAKKSVELNSKKAEELKNNIKELNKYLNSSILKIYEEL